MANPLAYLFQGLAGGAQQQVQKYPELLLHKREQDDRKEARKAELAQRQAEFGFNKKMKTDEFEIFKKKSQQDINLAALDDERKQAAHDAKYGAYFDDPDLSRREIEAPILASEAATKASGASTAFNEFQLGQAKEEAPLRTKNLRQQNTKMAQDIEAGEIDLESKTITQAFERLRLKNEENRLALAPLDRISAKLKLYKEFADMTGVDLAGAKLDKLLAHQIEVGGQMAEIGSRLYGSMVPDADAKLDRIMDFFNMGIPAYMAVNGITVQDLEDVTPGSKGQKARALTGDMMGDILSGDPERLEGIERVFDDIIKQGMRQMKSESRATTQPAPGGETGKGGPFKAPPRRGGVSALADDELIAAQLAGAATQGATRASLYDESDFRKEARAQGIVYVKVGDEAFRLPPTKDTGMVADSMSGEMFDKFVDEHDQFARDSLKDFARLNKIKIDDKAVAAWKEVVTHRMAMGQSVWEAIGKKDPNEKPEGVRLGIGGYMRPITGATK